MRSTLLALLMLGGCGYPLETFYEKKNETYCGLVIECGIGYSGWETEEQCVAALEEVQATGADGCEESYDPELGRDCVRGMRRMTCDDLSAGTNLPQECVDVCEPPDSGA